EAVCGGLPNLEKHCENVQAFGVPAVVALNCFPGDTRAEVDAVARHCEERGITCAVAEVFERGGAGGEDLGRVVLEMLERRSCRFRFLYDLDRPIKEKIETIVREIYGGEGVEYTPKAERAIAELETIGLGSTPVCMAKTQYSLSDDPTRLGRPRGFRITVRDVVPAAGAGFVVAMAGDILTMPGLPRVPAATRMRVSPDGRIEGLF
ncbi:MAG: formate--tetrahydrofolate ligase, partial [Gemmatimonadetes bacterium]|nr:formate--tetrahydrofolate ligase [Gemmatimonadota bacterium]